MATLAAHVERRITHVDERQGLGLTYHRLMLVMLLFAGVTALVVLRLGWLQLFTDRSAATALANPLIPPRADITDRNGIPLARTIDAWTIGAFPRRIIGDKAELARRLPRRRRLLPACARPRPSCVNGKTSRSSRICRSACSRFHSSTRDSLPCMCPLS